MTRKPRTKGPSLDRAPGEGVSRETGRGRGGAVSRETAPDRSTDGVSRETVGPDVGPVGPEQSAGDPESIEAFLGAASGTITAFATMLAAEGVLRGLIGPREVPRLWDRHLLNSAAVASFLPDEGSVIDVGSGAGFPGVVLAAMRPDLRITLIEPMIRRTDWLTDVVTSLGLRNVTVLRGRAEDQPRAVRADVVTARAVAPLDRLAGWCLPLVTVGGALVAMKGRRAGEELLEAQATLRRLGGDPGEVLEAPVVPGVEATTVVRVRRVR